MYKGGIGFFVLDVISDFRLKEIFCYISVDMIYYVKVWLGFLVILYLLNYDSFVFLFKKLV